MALAFQTLATQRLRSVKLFNLDLQPRALLWTIPTFPALYLTSLDTCVTDCADEIQDYITDK